ncbi:hypothetical protein AU252_22485 [Pseudarthrobacter sulfonivorans]|uniref:Uncharacterized protein n=1 Tax=Pseudarthrobacter sulfonivorans TaxID=121292 RepID=A0A0U3PDM3_9MICC|nr:hypothetical protein [Pseudarthrobacter sulfonivorans]ALV43600.1 hypothetical protein AU252_22485 [Pseudarthrobacter sulfonivorans]
MSDVTTPSYPTSTQGPVKVFMVEFTEQQSSLCLGYTAGRIHLYALHAGEVEHQPAFAHGRPGSAVPTAVYRQRQLLCAGEAHALHNVRCPSAAEDGCRASVDHGVENAAAAVVVHVLGRQQFGPYVICQVAQPTRVLVVTVLWRRSLWHPNLR